MSIPVRLKARPAAPDRVTASRNPPPKVAVFLTDGERSVLAELLAEHKRKVTYQGPAHWRPQGLAEHGALLFELDALAAKLDEAEPVTKAKARK